MNSCRLAALARLFHGLCLGLLIFAGPMPAWAEVPVDRYFTNREGLRLHYLEAGRGDRSLVFVPGWLMPAAVFRYQLEALSDHYRVIAFDPRSQGASEVSRAPHPPRVRNNDMEDLFKAAGIGEHILIGWSLGTMEILDYTRNHPSQTLRGVVFIDNSIGEGSAPPKSGKPSARLRALQTPALRENYLREFALGIFKAPPPQDLLNAVVASALRVPSAVAVELIQKPYPREYWRDSVYALQVPILYAVRPWLAPQARALQEKRPRDAQIEIFDDSSHTLFVDQAPRFNGALSAFASRAFALDRDLH